MALGCLFKRCNVCLQHPKPLFNRVHPIRTGVVKTTPTIGRGTAPAVIIEGENPH